MRSSIRVRSTGYPLVYIRVRVRARLHPILKDKAGSASVPTPKIWQCLRSHLRLPTAWHLADPRARGRTSQMEQLRDGQHALAPTSFSFLFLDGKVVGPVANTIHKQEYSSYKTIDWTKEEDIFFLKGVEGTLYHVLKTKKKKIDNLPHSPDLSSVTSGEKAAHSSV